MRKERKKGTFLLSFGPVNFFFLSFLSFLFLSCGFFGRRAFLFQFERFSPSPL